MEKAAKAGQNGRTVEIVAKANTANSKRRKGHNIYINGGLAIDHMW